MHNAAFEALGIEARYEALDVPPDALVGAVERLREAGVYGANVTVPHKLAALPLMDELTDAARAVGAVNTVVNRAGRLLGHNTDAAGFLRALKEDGRFGPEGARAVMLGAGGAARAVAFALLRAGVARLGVYNRTVERAVELARDFSAYGKIAPVEDLAASVRAADLLVNTTSVGLEHEGRDPDESPLPSGLLPHKGFVCDLIYHPAKTRLLRDAERAGLKVQNGLPMLVYQGAEAFEWWTGRAAPTEVMLRATQGALG